MDKVMNVVLSVTKNERVYSASLPYGAPLGEAHDALHCFLQEVLDMAKKAAEQAKPKEENPEVTN